MTRCFEFRRTMEPTSYVLFVMISIKQKVQYEFENVYKYFIVTNYLADSHELTRARALFNSCEYRNGGNAVAFNYLLH